jgi:hypothetical protein
MVEDKAGSELFWGKSSSHLKQVYDQLYDYISAA